MPFFEYMCREYLKKHQLCLEIIIRWTKLLQEWAQIVAFSARWEIAARKSTLCTKKVARVIVTGIAIALRAGW